MPKSKLRKNHKNKVQAWKERKIKKLKDFKEQLAKSIISTGELEKHEGLKIKIKED